MAPALALALAVCAVSASAQQKPAADAVIAFSVTRNDRNFGEHVLTFSRDGARTEVGIAIDFSYTLAFIPLFRYIHRNTEVWENGRLISLETRTDDDGQRHNVSARARDGLLEVRSSSGDRKLPVDIMSTSYWDRRILQQRALLNTQTGEVANVTVSEIGREPVSVAGREVMAMRYRIDGDLKTDIWYAEADDSWCKLRFSTKDGSIIEYHRRQ